MPKKEIKEKVDMLRYEKEWQAKGYNLVAGVDEVGRGPLAGPVVVASVIMPTDDIIPDVNDSKQVSEKKREKLYPLILEKAIAYSFSVIDEKVIDEINILEATKKAMKEAVASLSTQPDVVLIDAVKLDIPFETQSIIKGDANSYNIACASIIAKVYRDRMMVDFAKQYPNYGFEKNKGYGTAEHIRAIGDYGPCPIHRLTFIGKFLKK